MKALWLSPLQSAVMGFQGRMKSPLVGPGQSPSLEVPQEGTKALLGRGCNGVEEPLAKTRGITAHGLHILILSYHEVARQSNGPPRLGLMHQGCIAIWHYTAIREMLPGEVYHQKLAPAVP